MSDATAKPPMSRLTEYMMGVALAPALMGALLFCAILVVFLALLVPGAAVLGLIRIDRKDAGKLTAKVRGP